MKKNIISVIKKFVRKISVLWMVVLFSCSDLHYNNYVVCTQREFGKKYNKRTREDLKKLATIYEDKEMSFQIDGDDMESIPEAFFLNDYSRNNHVDLSFFGDDLDEINEALNRIILDQNQDDEVYETFINNSDKKFLYEFKKFIGENKPSLNTSYASIIYTNGISDNFFSNLEKESDRNANNSCKCFCILSLMRKELQGVEKKNKCIIL